MNFDDFFSQLKSVPVKIDIDTISEEKFRGLDNEALFQLPFICMVVLLMAKDRRKPCIAEIRQLVGESLETAISAFKGSSQHLGWSANLRIRTVTAISFLEMANLIAVNNRENDIMATELGEKVINAAINNSNNLSLHLFAIARAYRNICVDRKLDNELF